MELTKEQIEKSVSLGNINPKILRKLLSDMKLRSYSFDYNIQKELVNYNERKIPVSKGRSYLAKGIFSSNTNYVRVREYTVDYQFLIPGEKEAYLRSPIFNSYMDFDTLNTNKKFFRFVPLIFGDNKLLFNYKMQAYSERINIFFLEKDFDESINELTIMFIPDSLIATLDVTNSDFTGTNIAFDMFYSNKEFKKYNNYIGFWINKETQNSYLIPDIIKHQDEKFFSIGTLLPTDVSKYKLMLIGIQNLHSITQINHSTEWIQYDTNGMPLPKNNNIIFIIKDGNYYPNDGSIEIKEYYPNIYQIINPNNHNLIILSLYEDNSENSHIYYDNELKIYSLYRDIFFEYNEGTIPEDIKEFKPIPWDYSIEDFINKISYKDINFKNQWDSYIYKMNKVSTMLKKWYLMYEEFMKRNYGFLSGWYHNLGKFDNIDRKRRTNVLQDIDDEEYDIPFEEPQYVFTYLKDKSFGEANSYCFYIDGKYTIPTKIIVYRGIQYVYFPVRLIHNNSIIEVERFDGNQFSKYVELKSVGETVVDLSKLLKTPTVANSLFLVKPNGEFVSNYEIRTTVVDTELGEIEIDLDQSVFILETDAKLKLNPVNYEEGKVYLCCNNATYQFAQRESGNDYLLGRENEINLNYKKYIQKVKKNISSRLRIFNSEGRLIPKRSYDIYKYDNYFDYANFQIPIRIGTDEIFTISYIGYDERLIYHLDKVEPNGFIDLRGKISRPFNLTYHDLYLDGYRLTKYDIKMITPFSFVITSLAKFDTLSNIEIYEKIHVNEDFIKFEYGEESQYLIDKLFKNVESFYDAITEELGKISISGNTLNIDEVRDWFYTFFMDYFPYHKINPDYRQDLEAYHHVFEPESGRMILNPDERVKYKNKIVDTYEMNHDKSIELYGGELDSYPVSPLNNKNYDESVILPNPSVEMSEEEYLANGYTNENYERVYYPEIEKYNPEYIPTERKEDEDEYTTVNDKRTVTTEFRRDDEGDLRRYLYPKEENK